MVCNVGYVASVRIEYPRLFEELDAHGHDIKPESIKCTSCQRALASDGFCRVCNWGFVAGQLYFSKLTYSLARGSPQDVARQACMTCRENAKNHGWCAECRRGMVGNFAFRTKPLFREAVEQYSRLLTAVKTARTCEFCAIVMFTGGDCPECSNPRDDRMPRGPKSKSPPQTPVEPRNP